MDTFKCLQDVKDKIAAISNSKNLTNSSVIHNCYKFTITRGRKKAIALTDVSNFLTDKFADQPTLVSVPRLRVQIQSTIDKFNSLTKAVERNSFKIEHFIQDKFEFPLLESVPPQPPIEVETNSENLPLPESPTKTLGPKNTPLVTTPVKTRRDCFNCSSTKKCIANLQEVLKVEKREKNKLKGFSAAIKKHLHIRAKHQRLSRQEKKINELKGNVRKLKFQVQSLESNSKKILLKRNHVLKDLKKYTGKNTKLENELTALRKSQKDCELENKNLKIHIDYLEGLVKSYESKKSKHFVPKVCKTYTSDIRRLVYHQLVSDVPVKHCGSLISKFSEIMCGQQLKETPSPATCAQMAYELGTITTVQTIGHMIKSDKNICLSWDATTIDGSHVNEIHLTVDKSDCLVLDVRHLAGGQTSDYVSHIVSALTEATDVYARYTGTSQESIFAALKLKITSTLTDRAAVNACVTRQLCLELDAQLIQLNCNIHPLDSVARYSKQSLIEVDRQHKIEGACYGKEGTAVNLINAVSVLRFKDGTGDPVGFKNMLRLHNLPVGTFVRYVGNRMHVVFHLAGILIQHWGKLKDFILMQCTAAGLLRSRLDKDLSNEGIMAQVWALGVMGKVFSGPWMTKFYSSNMSNLEMRPLVQSSERQLQAWIQMPQSLFLPTCNVFSEALLPNDDDVLSSLHNFVSGSVDIQVDALLGVLRSCLTVLQRQLKLFLSENELPPETKDSVSSAPTHNMASERALGCLDKMSRRAPVAIGGFLNGKVRSKLNKCTQWLDTLPSEEQAQLIDFAVREARDERVRRYVLDRTVSNEITKRRQEVACERRQKDKKKVLKSVKKALVEKSVKHLDSIQCDDSVKVRIGQCIEEPECLVGLAFLLSLDSSEYYGRICSVQQNDVTVSYWGMEESESSSVDYSVSVFSFFADAILGAITFF